MRSRGRVSPPVPWVLALSLLATLPGLAVPVRAGALDPLAFTSLGSLNLGAGSIVINSDTLTISGAASFVGVIHDQGPSLQNGVSDFGRQVAVFDFSNISLTAGVTISLTGSRPVALLSRGNLTITPAITVSGSSGAGTLGGAGGAGGVAGGAGGLIGASGIGPGRGSAQGGDQYDGGGGAFGGNGGPGGVSSVAGLAYGDLLTRLQGGSSGGGALDDDLTNAGGGGGSGGAIELGAIGPITLGGGLTANGGDGGVGAYHGGGGSGGAIFLHGSGVTLGSSLTAMGGGGGFGGGGGGGGRIAIAPDTLSVTQLHGLLSSLSVNGGAGNTTSRRGRAGVIQFKPGLLSVAAAQSANFGVMAVGQTGQTDPAIQLLSRDLTVAAGGSATANTSSVFNSSGILTINGTLLLGSNSQTVSVLNGSGRVQVGPGASLTIGGGNLASVFSGTLDGGGSLIKNGSGEFTLTGNAKLNAPLTLNGGTLTISAGSVTIGSAIFNSGARPITVWNNATATFGGSVVTTGTVTVAGGSKAIFNDTFSTQHGTSGPGAVQINGQFLAGAGPASVNFGGDVGFGTLSSTKLEIGGTTAGTQRDRISVSGAASLAGEIRVGLINGFVPSPGDTFEIMTFGSRSGDVAVLGAPGSTGLGLTKSYTPTSLSVTVYPLLMADANYDGIVDKSDLARIAATWQGSGTWIDGDFNGDQFVDLRDLYIMANHWLETQPAAPFAQALDELGLPAIHVPEPVFLGLCMVPALIIRRSCRRS